MHPKIERRTNRTFQGAVVHRFFDIQSRLYKKARVKGWDDQIVLEKIILLEDGKIYKRLEI